MEKGNILPMLRIKELRAEKKMTQAVLSKKLGISLKTLRAYELGRRPGKGEKADEKETIPSNILIEMSKTFGCSTDYILGLSDCRTVESDLIHQYTGLSDPAISSLHTHRNDTTIDTVNLLASRLGSGRDRDDLLTLLTVYLQRPEDSTIGDIYFQGDGDSNIRFPGGATTDGAILFSVTQKLVETRAGLTGRKAQKKGSISGSKS